MVTIRRSGKRLLNFSFTSTRRGKSQIFLIGRDGKGLRQVTTVGNNYTPDWSR